MRRIALTTGIEVAVREYGTGVPVLLLHAWGETHQVFDRLLPLLPDTVRFVVLDQRGVGDSAKPATGYSLDDAAADVIALLDALGIERCWLVGTSSGGYLAQLVAVDHPERVLGLALVGAPSDLQGPRPPLEELVSSFDDPPTRADVGAVNDAIPLHAPVPASFLEDQLTAAMTIPKHVWQATLAALLGCIAPIRRGPIAVPTLILFGADEDVLPPGQADELAGAIPGSRLVTYESTGHLVLWEQPERVARDLAAFIAESPSVAVAAD